MLQNDNGIICFTVGSELRGNRTYQFRRLEKGSHTSMTRFASPLSGYSTTISFALHLLSYQRNILPHYPSRINMSKKHGATFSVFQLKVCCEAYFAHAPSSDMELLMRLSASCYSFAIAPNDLSVAFWTSVNPFTWVIFIRSYGLSFLSVRRHTPVCLSLRFITPS
jgi:hypothetical protein